MPRVELMNVTAVLAVKWNSVFYIFLRKRMKNPQIRRKADLHRHSLKICVLLVSTREIKWNLVEISTQVWDEERKGEREKWKKEKARLRSSLFIAMKFHTETWPDTNWSAEIHTHTYGSRRSDGRSRFLKTWVAASEEDPLHVSNWSDFIFMFQPIEESRDLLFRRGNKAKVIPRWRWEREAAAARYNTNEPMYIYRRCPNPAVKERYANPFSRLDFLLLLLLYHHLSHQQLISRLLRHLPISWGSIWLAIDHPAEQVI